MNIIKIKLFIILFCSVPFSSFSQSRWIYEKTRDHFIKSQPFKSYLMEQTGNNFSDNICVQIDTSFNLGKPDFSIEILKEMGYDISSKNVDPKIIKLMEDSLEVSIAKYSYSPQQKIPKKLLSGRCPEDFFFIDLSFTNYAEDRSIFVGASLKSKRAPITQGKVLMMYIKFDKKRKPEKVLFSSLYVL